MAEKELKNPGPEMIEKAKFDELMNQYQKLVNAFNKLLKEFNDLHVATLFEEK